MRNLTLYTSCTKGLQRPYKQLNLNGIKLAGVEGLEPPTHWFEARRSIQLSYTPAVSASMLAEMLLPSATKPVPTRRPAQP